MARTVASLPVVTLTRNLIVLAHEVGRARYAANVRGGVREQSQSSRLSGEQKWVQGTLGEIAMFLHVHNCEDVSEEFKRRVLDDTSPRSVATDAAKDLQTPDGRTIDVKTVRSSRFQSLMVRSNAERNPADLYASAALLDDPDESALTIRIEIRGFIEAAHLFRPENFAKQSPMGPAFVLPVSRLRLIQF